MRSWKFQDLLLNVLSKRMRQWADAVDRRRQTLDDRPGTRPPVHRSKNQAAGRQETRGGPPAHWVERVRRSAPQLLVPNPPATSPAVPPSPAVKPQLSRQSSDALRAGTAPRSASLSDSEAGGAKAIAPVSAAPAYLSDRNALAGAGPGAKPPTVENAIDSPHYITRTNQETDIALPRQTERAAQLRTQTPGSRATKQQEGDSDLTGLRRSSAPAPNYAGGFSRTSQSSAVPPGAGRASQPGRGDCPPVGGDEVPVYQIDLSPPSQSTPRRRFLLPAVDLSPSLALPVQYEPSSSTPPQQRRRDLPAREAKAVDSTSTPAVFGTSAVHGESRVRPNETTRPNETPRPERPMPSEPPPLASGTRDLNTTGWTHSALSRGQTPGDIRWTVAEDGDDRPFGASAVDDRWPQLPAGDVSVVTGGQAPSDRQRLEWERRRSRDREQEGKPWNE